MCRHEANHAEKESGKTMKKKGRHRVENALQQLEVGQVGVFGFDMEPQLLHPLDAPLTESAGARLLQSLTFDAQAPAVPDPSGKSRHVNSTDFAMLLDRALSYLDDCKAASSSSSAELQQV